MKKMGLEIEVCLFVGGMGIHAPRKSSSITLGVLHPHLPQILKFIVRKIFASPMSLS